MRLETAIISNLVYNEEFSRKVLPFIKREYFPDKVYNVIVDEVINFFNNYKKFPTKEILLIQVSNRSDINEQDTFRVIDEINNLVDNNTNSDWILDETEKYFKERAVYNAILDSIQIIEGKSEFNKEAIPSILSDALSICFNKNIGHDYINDADARFDFYNRVEERLPFDIELLNKITGGGLPKKSLTVFMSGPGGGKSLIMGHCAGSALLQNKNVLYISAEMSEERIAERVDANLLNLGMVELKTIERSIFNKRINNIKLQSTGSLIIKEYPTGSAHAGHFRALIGELKVKRDFSPDLIIVDYLNICASERIRTNSGANSYSYIKAIVEEIRGLAIEFDVPIITATQVNRGGVNNTDVEMTNVSDSMGTSHTADLMLAIINSDELDQLGQIMIKQLKNRYNDVNYYNKFLIGIDKNKMKLFNIENSAQSNIVQPATTKQKVVNTNDFKF